MALKRLDNPPNPYLSAYQEWLEEPPAVKVEVYEEEAHSILATNDSPDVGFKWSVNPYRGCQHACAYCYARRTHEFLGFGAGTDFETRLVVKINAGQRLEEAFRSKNWKREPVIFSGVTDCYQPLEAVYGLTRSCLEVCRRFHNPIGLVTKSYLVVRDADVLAELAAVASVKVMISIPFRDAATARLIEPGAPPPERRFEALKRLADAGVPVGIMTAPIIPGLNDRDVPELLARAAACGARSAGWVALRLPGSVEPVFLSRLRAAMPLRYERIVRRIREIRGGSMSDGRFGHRMTGQGTYWASIMRLFEVAAKRHGLNRAEEDREVDTCAAPPPDPREQGRQLELPFG
ncbi:MAG: radical SAM protein [Phycisphaerae bacterium]